jgi:hypothetical protein
MLSDSDSDFAATIRRAGLTIPADIVRIDPGCEQAAGLTARPRAPARLSV